MAQAPHQRRRFVIKQFSAHKLRRDHLLEKPR
jgi:hypothetical protein